MNNRISIPDIAARKGKGRIAALTAYTAPAARLLDGQVDILLVGDSLGMVVYGMDSTLPVTLDMMIAHGRAVVKASAQSCVVVDMPFGSVQAGKEKAFEQAARVMSETGCSGVKIEGGVEMAETIVYLTARGIPVIGHVGMQPQRMHMYGGFRMQGKNEPQKKHILADALAVEKAGVFAMVVEAVPASLAELITRQVHVPTIGIGAGAGCDGQILVLDDMLGMFERTPAFVKRYAEIGEVIRTAVNLYTKEVRAGKFPAKN